ncbi:dihydroorotate dehydrogenase electron transfer subunit [Paramuribaculum intestinale]|uniref:dihydroorotate dehydrogenase electron transfer subunit n=2 Tax=Paramuribaculum intestinale TaxID=2094151 RepID=UPI0025B6B9EC|nr:dihydroorotate dehydrogenase electron transfer subunit [Paramuribaculum intestinale]
MVKKTIKDFTVKSAQHLSEAYTLLKLTPTDGTEVTTAMPGQFVQVAVPDAPNTFLRRPISVNFIDRSDNTLWLLVRNAGEGTSRLCEMKTGEHLNIILPLGNGFSMPEENNSTPKRLLLVGGGVGVAPLLYLGHALAGGGHTPEFLLGARSCADLLELDEFKRIGTVHVATDDGSAGVHGLVTQHPVINSQDIDCIYCCGPAPMMKAVAAIARQNNVACEVSLENMMACGLGACLCCVENTVKGNVCVCTEGPVFNITQLTWQ